MLEHWDAVAGLLSPPACLEEALSFVPCLAVFPRVAPSFVKLGPPHGCLERENGTIPPHRRGSISKFLSKGYLCKRCLVPSPPQPRRPEPSLFNGSSAELRSSNTRSCGGTQLLAAPGAHLVHPTLLRLLGLIPCTTPHNAGAAGIRGMLHHCCHTSGLSAQLLFFGSMEIWIHMQATALPTHNQRRLGASASPGTLVALPPGSLPCAMGISEVKMFSFMEKLYLIKIPWETSTQAACHLLPLHELCP